MNKLDFAQNIAKAIIMAGLFLIVIVASDVNWLVGIGIGLILYAILHIKFNTSKQADS